MQRKKIVLVALALILCVGIVSAALLEYYGRIITTAIVKQSVLVDGQDYTDIIQDIIPVDVPGGETFCFKHTLTNLASVPATVNFETIYSAVDLNGEWMNPDGVTATYYEPLGYIYNTEIPINGSNSPLVVTVEDGDCNVTWTFDFPVEGWTGNGNLNVGLIIALDGDGKGPAFQIHNNDGTTKDYPDGTWLYSPWGPTITDGWFGWHSGDTNTPVTALDWVEASGVRKGQGTDGILTITINKDKLCEDFHWAASPTVGSGFYTPVYDVTMQIPSAFVWNTPIVNMSIPNYEDASLLGAVTSMTIPSGETIDFYICYSFEIAIESGTYTITTTVKPA